MDDNVVLVIGGAGYIGSHACKALASAGFTPVVFDNLVYGHEYAVKWGPFEFGDLLDIARIEQILAKYHPVAVMHFAAFAYVGESVQDPAKYYRNNVIGSLNLLEAMRRTGVARIVFSSTCATYGMPERVPIDEEHGQHPVNPYGTTKLIIEQALADYASAYGFRSVALRYFNAAGADTEGDAGEDHDPETHLIPLVLEVAAGHRDHISIFGDDYETPDGTCVRDYIHVSDLAQAHLLALTFLKDKEGFHAFNLGNGHGFSVKEVVDVAKEITGREIPVKIGSRRAGDPPILVGDASRAKELLGWKPRFSALDVIIDTAWKWQQRQ